MPNDEGRLAGIEEAALWHDGEAERIGRELNSPRSACNTTAMVEAIGDHESAAYFIRQLKGAQGPHTIAGLPSFVDSLRRRLKEKTGDAYVFAQIAVTVDGWRVYFSPNGPSMTFEAPFLAEAIEKAEDWLTRNELSEVNMTLGLTADGVLDEAQARR